MKKIFWILLLISNYNCSQPKPIPQKIKQQNVQCGKSLPNSRDGAYSANGNHIVFSSQGGQK